MSSKIPFASVIIPTFNEAEFIKECLDSIYALYTDDYSFEVITVDNGSTDSTTEIVKKYPAKLIKIPNINVGAVRNRGAAIAKGKILAFVDGDCVVPNRWLYAGIIELQKDNIGAVGGNCFYRENANWVEKAWALKKRIVNERVLSLTTGSFIIKKSVFDAVGQFNESLIAGEDTEISKRIREKGYSLYMIPQCWVVHLGYPRTINSFIRRQYWQTSDYLQTINDKTDKIFYITHFFLFAIIALIISILSVKYVIFLISLALLAGIPTVVGLAKLYRSDEIISFILICQVILINLFYFIGRSFGLIKSYYRTIKKWIKKYYNNLQGNGS